MLSRKAIDVVLSLPLTIFLSGLVACSTGQSNNEKIYAVSWHPGFTMPELLAENVDVERREDLSALLSKEWYASVDVSSIKNAEEGTFSTCEEYLKEVSPETRTLHENEMSAFVELALMCRATVLLSNADNPHASYIPDDVIIADSPDEFPSVLAFQTSNTESEKSHSDPTVQYWSDINEIRKVESVSPHAVDFYTNGGVQRVELVGRGDFNGDGVEDIVLSSRDSVEGGSYRHLRLFVLSVDAEGNWQEIKSYR